MPEAPSYVPTDKKPQWEAVWGNVYDRAVAGGAQHSEAEERAYRQANGVAGPNAMGDIPTVQGAPTSLVDEQVAAAEGQDYATVGGVRVHRSDFAYAPAGSKPSEWKLPVDTEARARNALARYNQADLPAEAKAGVRAKILAAAKKFGIDTSGFEEKHAAREYHITTQLFSQPGTAVPANPEISGAKELYEIPVAATTGWKFQGGKRFRITDSDLDSMVDNFKKGKGQIVIDFEHASENPEVAQGGPVPAAGWMHDLRKRSGTLVALVEWTQQAKEMIKGGLYRFFSPAIDWGYDDKETGKPQGATLTSGALTNHPFLEKELPPILLSDVNMDDISQVHVPAAVKDISVGFPQPGSTEEQRAKAAAEGHQYSGKSVTASDKEKPMAKHKVEFRKIEDGEHAGKMGMYIDGEFHDVVDGDMKKKLYEGGPAEGKEEQEGPEKGKMEARDDGYPGKPGGVPHPHLEPDGDVDEGGKEQKGNLRARDTQRQDPEQRYKLLCTFIDPDTNRILLTEAARAADLGKLLAGDILRMQDASGQVERAIHKGLVAPKQRASALKMVLRDMCSGTTEFADFLKVAKPYVDLQTHGVSEPAYDAASDDPSDQLEEMVQVKLSDYASKGIKRDRAQVLSEVTRKGRGLELWQAHSRRVTSGPAHGSAIA